MYDPIVRLEQSSGWGETGLPQRSLITNSCRLDASESRTRTFGGIPGYRFSENPIRVKSLSYRYIMDAKERFILFIFRGLLNEQAGANIRNEIAHGIIGEKACSSGVCLYFGVAVIKLLSYTSLPCYEILKNSEKSRHFEMPPKVTLKAMGREEDRKRGN